MGLAQIRKHFFAIRDKCKILIKNHAFIDYPERGFSKQELVNLVKYGVGPFVENDSLIAIKASYLFFPKDLDGRECKLVLLIDEVEFEKDGAFQNEAVIVCSAYREMIDEA